MTVYILGGGPAGLATAAGLMDAGFFDFVVIERDEALGGLARTVQWDGIGSHDLGPHKIFSLDTALVKRIERLLPAGDWLTREKISSIFMGGHYLPYPPSPFSLIGIFGLPAFAKMVLNYAWALALCLIHPTNPVTFEEDLDGRMGKALYEILFRPIALKLWDDPVKLDVKLSRGRVQTPSLGEVLGRLLKLRKSSDFEALTFRYPKGGLSTIWNAIEARGSGKAHFEKGQTVTNIEAHGGIINGLTISHEGQLRRLSVGPDDFVVSTLPLADTIHLMEDALPVHFSGVVERTLRLNDLMLVFLHVDTPSLIKESWVFIPDPHIVFHRLSEQETFDPAMTPNGSIVCCEIMSSPARELAKLNDAALIEASIQGLRDMGYAGFDVLHSQVLRFPKSYPVFYAGFEAGLHELVSTCDSFENFRTIGRQGAFNYIGTLDAMDIGYGFARWIAAGRDPAAWQAERARTNHYPVLD